jgi:hypothetical protein
MLAERRLRGRPLILRDLFDLDAGAADLTAHRLLADVDVFADGDLAGHHGLLLDDGLLGPLDDLDGLLLERGIGLVGRERLVGRRLVDVDVHLAEPEGLLLDVSVDVLVDADAAADDLALADLELLLDLAEPPGLLVGVLGPVLGCQLGRVGRGRLIVVGEVDLPTAFRPSASSAMDVIGPSAVSSGSTVSTLSGSSTTAVSSSSKRPMRRPRS